jgi:hypothetical protein
MGWPLCVLKVLNIFMVIVLHHSINGTLHVNGATNLFLYLNFNLNEFGVILCACNKIFHKLYFQLLSLHVNCDVFHSCFCVGSQGKVCEGKFLSV